MTKAESRLPAYRDLHPAAPEPARRLTVSMWRCESHEHSGCPLRSWGDKMDQLAWQAPKLSDRVLHQLITIKHALRNNGFVSRYQLECSVCGYRGLFRWSGDPPRRDA